MIFTKKIPYITEEVWYKIKRTLVQLAQFQKRSRLKRYTFPLVLVAFIFLTKHFLHPVFGKNSAFLLASFIVAASAWYGGLGPGFFATILAAIATYILYLSTDIATHSFAGDFIVLLIFIVEGLAISIVSEARYEVEKQKDEFISFVSHELKNPLAAIRGFAELTIRSTRISKNERVKGYGEQIRGQADKILELINDLLDITKIEIGKFTYSNEIVDVDDLVRDIVMHQRIIAKNRKINLVGRLSKTITGDSYRIRQAIVNLLTNALKYSVENKPVTIRMRSNMDRIHISVRDYGVGIPEDEQSRIFDRYYRTRNAEKKRLEGIGLGLFITNQIVKHHEGDISVNSEPGRGSIFTIILPVNKT